MVDVGRVIDVGRVVDVGWVVDDGWVVDVGWMNDVGWVSVFDSRNSFLTVNFCIGFFDLPILYNNHPSIAIILSHSFIITYFNSINHFIMQIIILVIILV